MRGFLNRNNYEDFEWEVFDINNRVLWLVRGLIEYKIMLLLDVLLCKLFIVNYFLFIDYILREVKFYFMLVRRF